MKQGLFRLKVKKNESERESETDRESDELKKREWMKIVTLNVSKMLIRMKERRENWKLSTSKIK